MGMPPAIFSGLGFGILDGVNAILPFDAMEFHFHFLDMEMETDVDIDGAYFCFCFRGKCSCQMPAQASVLPEDRVQ
jgi:hypothetical protein